MYPYLLRGMTLNQANHAWGMDITSNPMARGFIYLYAVVDWASRKILAHRVSITMDTSFCLDTLEDAISRYGKPGIVNTDQGSKFISAAFTDVLREHGIRISMDGKSSWRDNVFIERVWRSIKYEEVYLKAYASVSEATASLAKYIDFYNSRHPHSKLDKKTPNEFYCETLPALPQAA